MAYRYTDTEKWKDHWFTELKPMEKLLFYYMVDNCDIAGFIEVNLRLWAAHLNTDIRQTEGAFKGLARGYIISKCETVIFIRNFIKHQKNLPINENNKAHQGILKCFDKYSQVFEIQDIQIFIEGAMKGLISPSGKGNGNGIGKIILEETWKTNFEIYKNDLREAYRNIVTAEYIAEREKYHPGLDIKSTLEKSIKDYWIMESGWKNKKTARTVNIDWKATFNKALSSKLNQVWKPRTDSKPEPISPYKKAEQC
jgi:hypothetical protein